MIVSAKGRSYQPGKALSTEIRRLIIDEIVKEGGDVFTGYFPGSFNQVARQFHVSRTAVQKIWSQNVETGSLEARWKGGNNPPHLQEQDLELIEGLKSIKPSLPYAKLLEAVNRHCFIPGGTSKSAIGRTVQYRLDGGPRTWKRLSRATCDKFTQENTDYCQDFLNFMSSVDPYRVKFFDECGFRLPDECRPNYGHSLVNKPCVEIGRYLNTPNATLNLLIGLEGVLYANTEDGATDTLTFLNFWGEAGENRMLNGRPILQYGDILVLDNCATHHYDGGYFLAEWLDVRGIDVVYLPVYAPEFNPCELAFNKLKILAKQGDIKAVFNRNIHEGIYECLEYVTDLDCVGFYRHCQYLNL